MGYYREYRTRKDRRKSPTGGKSVDKTCRNHGSCKWCMNNRQYKHIKKYQSFQDKINEIE